MGAGGGGGGGGGGAGGVGGGAVSATTTSVSSPSGGAISGIDLSGINVNAGFGQRTTGFYNTSRKAAASSSMPIRSLIEPINSYIQATRGLT
jgi:hypothetical protein